MLNWDFLLLLFTEMTTGLVTVFFGFCPLTAIDDPYIFKQVYFHCNMWGM